MREWRPLLGQRCSCAETKTPALGRRRGATSHVGNAGTKTRPCASPLSRDTQSWRVFHVGRSPAHPTHCFHRRRRQRIPISLQHQDPQQSPCRAAHAGLAPQRLVDAAFGDAKLLSLYRIAIPFVGYFNCARNSRTAPVLAAIACAYSHSYGRRHPRFQPAHVTPHVRARSRSLQRV